MNNNFLGTEVQTYNNNGQTMFVANARYNIDGIVYIESAQSNTFDGAKQLAKDKLEANIPVLTKRDTMCTTNGTETHTTISKETFNGGGSKQISRAQKQFIINLCRKESIDVCAYCNMKFGKDLDELQGQEANIIIKELKK